MPLLEELQSSNAVPQTMTVPEQTGTPSNSLTTETPITESLNRGIQGMTSAFSNIARSIPRSRPRLASMDGGSFDMSPSGGTIDAFSKAITQQESGNYKAVNKDSGALGAYQIMPFHLPEIGLPNSQEGINTFINSPALQDKLHMKIITNLYDKYGGNFQKMAAAYYGGGGGASVVGTAAGNKPQGGGKYPSINAYVSSVMAKMKKFLPAQPKYSIAGQKSAPNMESTDVSQIPPKAYNNIKRAMDSIGNETVDYGGETKYEGVHPGVDIANKIGTPINAFTPGVVTKVETGHKQGDNGFGNYIIITDPYGAQHRYSHLSQSFVRVGQKVGQGNPIAAMGNTGSTYSESGGTGSHLDYRISDAYGKYQNPYQYLSKFYNQ